MTPRRSVADRVAAALAAERFGEVETAVAPQRRRMLSATKVRNVWRRALRANGGYVRRGEPIAMPVLDGELFDYPVTHQRGALHVQIAVNDAGEVTGLVVRPGEPTGRFGE